MITAIARATTAMPSGGKIFWAMASAMKPFHRMLVWKTDEYSPDRTMPERISSGNRAKVKAPMATNVHSRAAIIESIARVEKSAL